MTNNVFIIAEAGVNHNGSLEIAKKLVDAALETGANAVKFQTFRAEKLASRFADQVRYQIENTRTEGAQIEMLKKLELPYAVHKELKEHCRSRGILFLSTPFDEESARFLVGEIGVPMIKIPSGEVTNLPYLESLAALGLPVILSTGMSDLEEVRGALAALETGLPREAITLLHCTTSYPCPFEDVNLKAMITLRDVFGVRVGYSDHTPGIEVAVAAAALGAQVIEKHLTLDQKMEGPDHRCSLESREFKAMVDAVRNVERALGSAEKKPAESERHMQPLVRKSLVPVKNLKAGKRLEKNDLTAKRAGEGIAPGRIHEVVGKVLKTDKAEDEVLCWNDLI